jgi:hypothetical protein
VIAASQAGPSTVYPYWERRQRLKRLRGLLGPDAVPTFGEFAMAAGFEIWQSHALDSALEDATKAGLRMPELWVRLSHSGHLFLLKEDWRHHRDWRYYRDDIAQFCETVCAAMRSPDGALAWSARASVVMVFRQMLGIKWEPWAKPIIERLVASIRFELPPQLHGATAECDLITLGVQYFGDHFAPPSWSLQSALANSEKAACVFRRLLPGWHPSYSIGLGPVDSANNTINAMLSAQSGNSGNSEPVRVIAPVPELVLYLNTIYDVALQLAKVLPDVVASTENVVVQDRQQALRLAGDWGICAWVAAKGVRRWHENLERGKGGSRTTVAITAREMSPLDYAVKNYRASGWDALSSALASVLTSYARIERKFRKRNRGEVGEDVREEHFDKIASKYAVFIREAGFWVPDQRLSGGAQMVRNNRPKNAAPVKEYERLHEEVGHASGSEGRLWDLLFKVLDEAPSLTNGGRGERKVHLLHLIRKTLTETEPFAPKSGTLPRPEKLRPELEPLRDRIVPVLFRLCLKHCRLKSALKLLVVGNGIKMHHLRDFLRLWGRIHLAWPQAIDPALEFRDQAMSVFSRYSQGPDALLADDNDYFEVLEALHGPMLAMLGARGDGAFQSWIDENLHEVAEGGWFDRSMLLPRVDWTNATPAHLPTLHWFHEVLKDIGQRTQKPVAWVSFVSTSDKILGLTMSGGHDQTMRWTGDLPQKESLHVDANAYLAELAVGTRCCGWRTSRQKVKEKRSLEVLLSTLWEQIRSVGCNGIVLMNCPPELNSLPWRALLQAWKRSSELVVPPIYTVPGAAWLLKRYGGIAGTLELRTGAHGNPAPMGGGFYATVIVPESAMAPRVGAGKEHFDHLRELCRTNSIVIDNVCFAGKSGSWHRSEWNGNPAALLFPGACKLLVAPPCLIPRSTTKALEEWVNQKRADGESIGSSQLVEKLDAMAVTDSAALLYNMYGIPVLPATVQDAKDL